MTPLDWANLLKDYGGWGLSAILMGVIVYLDRDRQASRTSQIALVKELVTAMAASTNAMTRFQEALEALRVMLDARGQTVGDLSHRIDIVVEKIQHGLGNLGGSMQAIANWIEKERDRDRNRAREREEDRERGRP
jgi:uncharacterized coiled-coil DUF342 family protein